MAQLKILSLDDYQSITALLNYQPNNSALFEAAFVHRSYWGDKQGKKAKYREEGLASYERLEFLGDRVLGLAISSLLYQQFPHEKEGGLSKRLTKLVSREQIADIVQKIGLHHYLLLSEGEAQSGSQENPALQADLGEAIIGALWLDDGEHAGKAAFDFIKTHWQDRLIAMVHPPKEAKTALQEWCMANQIALPDYQLIHQEGPDHAPEFTMRLSLEGMDDIEAKGKSVRATQKLLAKAMLKRLEAK